MPNRCSSPRRRDRTLPAARARQPPRPDHRRHRHRQDRDAADAWPSSFSRIGVPVFMADVKGDLSGIAAPGALTPKLKERAQAARARRARRTQRCPVVFWDVFGEQGHPVRATISDMGPLLLGRLLNLNETQEGVLDARLQDRRRQRAAAARPEGPARDAAVRRRQRAAVHDRSTATSRPRRSARSSAGCSTLEQQGGDKFFGEPTLDIDDLMQTDAQGPRRGQHPRRRQADAARPSSTRRSCCGCCRSCSSTCPRSATRRSRSWCSSSTRRTCCSTTRRTALLEKIEQVVRLIRSKGVGVYFVTQNPLDIPDTCSASSATACSTRCAPSRRATRRR